MTESIKDTLVKGYGNWRKNLVLGVPTMLQVIAAVVCFFIALVFTGIYLGRFASGPTPLDYAIYATMMLLGCLIYLLMNSFLVAASYGMSKKAVEGGKIHLGLLMESGQRWGISIFSATVISLLAVIVLGIALIGPGVVVQLLYQRTNISLGLFLIGSALYAVFLAALVYVYIPLPALIVTGDLGAVQGIKESLAFSKKNKTKIVILFGSYMALTWATNLVLGMLMNPFDMLSQFVPLLGGLVVFGLMLLYMAFVTVTLAPLYIVWVTRLVQKNISHSRQELPQEPEKPGNQEQPSAQRPIYI